MTSGNSISGSTFRRLKSDGVKGENGCIVVVGGSRMYTGAPMFAALGALRSGSELVYILTSEDSVEALKGVPEAIVLPFRADSNIMKKATACVVGPGLGRPEALEEILILDILEKLNARGIPFVIDADAIHLYKAGVLSHLRHVVLTPNHREKIGLVVADGHFCIEKGQVDVIKGGSSKRTVDIPSSLKRCGGQGDILSGILATALTLNSGDVFDACVSSCELLRVSASRAFHSRGFSLMTRDIFDHMCDALSDVTGAVKTRDSK